MSTKFSRVRLIVVCVICLAGAVPFLFWRVRDGVRNRGIETGQVNRTLGNILAISPAAGVRNLRAQLVGIEKEREQSGTAHGVLGLSKSYYYQFSGRIEFPDGESCSVDLDVVPIAALETESGRWVICRRRFNRTDYSVVSVQDGETVAVQISRMGPDAHDVEFVNENDTLAFRISLLWESADAENWNQFSDDLSALTKRNPEWFFGKNRGGDMVPDMNDYVLSLLQKLQYGRKGWGSLESEERIVESVSDLFMAVALDPYASWTPDLAWTIKALDADQGQELLTVLRTRVNTAEPSEVKMLQHWEKEFAPPQVEAAP